MGLLEEGARVIEWIAIARDSSKNRALAAGTRRLVHTARTRYLSFGSVNTYTVPAPAPPTRATVDRTPSFGSLLQEHVSPVQTVNPVLTAPLNGAWASDFSNSAQPLATGSSQSSSGHFDWTGFPYMTNTGPSQHRPQHQVPSSGLVNTMPVGQISPMDLALPLTSPIGNAHPSNPINFGHLPMMPNQMDNWPMSMQNLGMTPTPDAYAPSSEGFDVWLSSILSDGNGNEGQGQGNGP